MEISLPEVITDENRRQTVENVLRVYRRRAGADYQIFVNQVKRERAHLLNHLGMSDAGHFLRLMEIPAKLFYLMCHVFGRHWVDDPKTAMCFMDAFREARINENSVPDFKKSGRDTEPEPLPYDPREIMQ